MMSRILPLADMALPAVTPSPDKLGPLAHGSAPQPSRRELLLLVFTAAAVFLPACSYLRGWHSLLASYADNDAYLSVAAAISHCDFRHLGRKPFMGYPYFVALLELLLGIPSPTALELPAFPPSVLAT